MIPAAISGSCQARYGTGEFKGYKCIEKAKEERYGLGLCRTHAKVFDRFLCHGFEYAQFIVQHEWGAKI